MNNNSQKKWKRSIVYEKNIQPPSSQNNSSIQYESIFDY